MHKMCVIYSVYIEQIGLMFVQFHSGQPWLGSPGGVLPGHHARPRDNHCHAWRGKGWKKRWLNEDRDGQLEGITFTLKTFKKYYVFFIENYKY